MRPRSRRVAAGLAAVAALAGVAAGGAGAGVARAAAPIAGARYAATIATAAGSASVVLTLADDGRELASPSRIALREACTPTEELTDVLPLDGRSTRASRSVSIGAGGRFAHRSAPVPGSRRTLVVTGAFGRGGRLATGTARLREDRPCPDMTLRFRARLAGRPDAPRPGRWTPCDRVVTGWFDFPDTVAGTIENVSLPNTYTISDHGSGCTTARELARRFDASLRCRDLPAGGTCGVHGATCTALHGGRSSPLASARCALRGRRAADAELVHLQPCLPPATAAIAVGAWAIDADCEAATSYPFDALLPDAGGTGPCGALAAPGPFRCTQVAGFACRGRVLRAGPAPALRVTCVDTADPASTLRFTAPPRSARPALRAGPRLRPGPP